MWGLFFAFVSLDLPLHLTRKRMAYLTVIFCLESWKLCVKEAMKEMVLAISFCEEKSGW